MKNQKVILTKGLPASGKTTWAREMVKKEGYKRVNKDELRSMIDDSKWSKKNEKDILAVRNQMIMHYLMQGHSIIVDDTNLNPIHKKDIERFVKEIDPNIQIEIKDFTDVPLDICILRDKDRSNPVGEKVIRGMYNQYLCLKETVPGIEYDTTLPDAIVCDLDGTLALLNGRNPYDASTCENDLVNEPILHILRTYREKGFKIILTSGRSGKYKQETIAWLMKNNIQIDELNMRREGNNEKDSSLKKRIYETWIKGKFNVLFVLDDRNQVVELWRSLGLTCLQVAPGDF